MKLNAAGEWLMNALHEEFTNITSAAECEETLKLVNIPLTDNQYSALFSLIGYIGPTAFRSSRMLRLLNEGDVLTAAGEFERFIYFPQRSKCEDKFLIKHRKKEKKLFLTPEIVKGG